MNKNDIEFQPYHPPAANPAVTGLSSPVPATVPGYPFIEELEIPSFLNAQLLTRDLDEISPWLWLFQTPSSNISPLHHQVVRQREIVVTEKMGLHLLWHTNRIFIKPLPSYLLDENFRKKYVDGNRDIEVAVRGYLRTYSRLLQSPSDMDIAKEKKLLPKSAIEDPERLFALLKRYSRLPDDDVSFRFQYGELQLSRINVFIKMFRLQPGYHEVYGQYRTYFGRFMGPFLFIFGTVSVILSAMQVALSAAQNHAFSWKPYLFEDVSRWFSIVCIGIVVAMISTLVTIFVCMAVHEGAFILIHGFSRWKSKNKGRFYTA